jgi:hypothetical protein
LAAIMPEGIGSGKARALGGALRYGIFRKTE